MRRLIILISMIAISSTISMMAAEAIGTKGSIYLIALEDDIINPVAAEYIIASIDRTERDGAACLIIQLDTPGGLLSSTRSIVKRMMNAKVPIAAYVAPKGARAGSAGVFITLAANIAAMAPSTNIGAAHPVELSDKRDGGDALKELLKKIGGGDKKDEKEPEEVQATPMEEKIMNDTKAWVEAIAKERGRNARWALSAVEKSISVTDSDALKEGIIDFIADDVDDLVAKLNGRTVRIENQTITLDTEGAALVNIPKDFRIKWLTVLAHPNIAYILMMLGFYGLLFEFTHPGIGFPGVAGAVCLILAFFGLQVLPTNYAGVALIVLAIIMLIAEIKVTSYGLLTIGGLITLFLGSLILFSSPYDFMRVSLPIVLAFMGATLSIAIFLTVIFARIRRLKPSTGTDGMVGISGDVISWEGSDGKVLVHGEIWNAKCDHPLKKGDRIRVSIVDGMTVLVEMDQQ